jgi:D-glycero-alpha-D-manno-heptose-7-phosphate kinase
MRGEWGGFAASFVKCAGFGGFICLDIQKDGQVNVSPLRIQTETLRELEHNLVFFYTGIKRSSSTVLVDQASAVKQDGSVALEKVSFLKKLVECSFLCC